MGGGSVLRTSSGAPGAPGGAGRCFVWKTSDGRKKNSLLSTSSGGGDGGAMEGFQEEQ